MPQLYLFNIMNQDRKYIKKVTCEYNKPDYASKISMYEKKLMRNLKNNNKFINVVLFYSFSVSDKFTRFKNLNNKIKKKFFKKLNNILL